MRSTPPRASTFSVVMSNRRYLKLVLPRFATRIFMVVLGAWSLVLSNAAARNQDPSTKFLFSKKRFQDGVVRAWDDVSADQLAVLAGGLGAGVNGGADGADVAADEGGHVSAADLHLAGQGDVGRLAHGVGRGDGGDQALGLDQAEGLVVVAVSR